MLETLMFLLGPVNPWLALLWFLSALVLGGLIVYFWQRLSKV